MMLQGSFQPIGAFVKMPPQPFSIALTLRNYQEILNSGPSALWAFNSLLVVVSTITIALVVNGLAGYAFAFGHFKGKDVLFWIVVGATFVTRYSLLVSQFVIVQKLALPPIVAVVSMTIFWPVGIFLFRNYFATIPSSLLETARMDGAHEVTIFFRVVLPLSLPVIGATVVFLGMAAMQDYIWQNLLLLENENMTLLVGLVRSTQKSLLTHTVKNYGLDFAIASLITLPLAVIFALGSRYFVGGLTGGAIKE
jgi:ABC-type glycerol-3-phosphate transport system permease component